VFLWQRGYGAARRLCRQERGAVELAPRCARPCEGAGVSAAPPRWLPEPVTPLGVSSARPLKLPVF